MLKVNCERYTWDQLVRKFPGKWVVVKNSKCNLAGDIEEGDLIAVCNDDEIDDFIVACYDANEDVVYDRTTCESGVGVINAENFEYITF